MARINRDDYENTWRENGRRDVEAGLMPRYYGDVPQTVRDAYLEGYRTGPLGTKPHAAAFGPHPVGDVRPYRVASSEPSGTV